MTCHVTLQLPRGMTSYIKCLLTGPMAGL